MARTLNPNQIRSVEPVPFRGPTADGEDFGAQVGRAGQKLGRAVSGLGSKLDGLAKAQAALQQRKQKSEDKAFLDRLDIAGDMTYQKIAFDEQGKAKSGADGYFDTLRTRYQQETPGIVSNVIEQGGYRPSEDALRRGQTKLMRRQYQHLKRGLTYENNERVRHLKDKLGETVTLIADSHAEAGEVDTAIKRIETSIAAYEDVLSPNDLADVRKDAAKVVFERFKATMEPGELKGAADRIIEGYKAQTTLFDSIIQQESSGNPNAVSPKGAVGLAQVMPATAREIAEELGDDQVEDMTEAQLETYLKRPDVSVRYGKHYFGKMLDRYNGDVEAALVAYNGGPGRADNWLEAGKDDDVLPEETRNYYREVLSRARKREVPVRAGGPDQEAARIGEAKPVLTALQQKALSGVEQDVITRFASLQGVLGREFKILSGFRSEAHNERVGGAPGSLHLDGKAIDIDVSDLSRDERRNLIRRALEIGFTGIGVYKNSIHLDTGKRRAWGASYGRDSLPGWAARVIQAHLSGEGEDDEVRAAASVAPVTLEGEFVRVLIENRDQLQRDADRALEGRRFEMKRMLEDDVESIRRTGQGVDGIELDQFSQVLTENQINRYVQKRRQAKRIYDATHDLWEMQDDKIEERLESLEPEPGADDFAFKADVYDEATKIANDIREMRENDPAKAVGELPMVTQAAANVDPQDPRTVQNLVRTRLEAQERVGVREASRQPITRAEAKVIAAPLQNLSDADYVGALEDLANELQPRYGPLTDEVMTSAIEMVIRSRSAAETMNQIIASFVRKGTIPQADIEALREELETEAVDRAVSPESIADQAAEQFPSSDLAESTRLMEQYLSGQTPPNKAIQFLRQHPEMAPQFDQKYGAGSAQRYLEGAQ
jgi:hypothetical protein